MNNGNKFLYLSVKITVIYVEEDTSTEILRLFTFNQRRTMEGDGKKMKLLQCGAQKDYDVELIKQKRLRKFQRRFLYVWTKLLSVDCCPLSAEG